MLDGVIDKNRKRKTDRDFYNRNRERLLRDGKKIAFTALIKRLDIHLLSKRNISKEYFMGASDIIKEIEAMGIERGVVFVDKEEKKSF